VIMSNIIFFLGALVLFLGSTTLQCPIINSI
jgi:hypothetical protein